MISRTTRARLLVLTVVMSLTFLAMLVVFPGTTLDPRPPAEAEALAVWLSRSPANWHAASALTDAALDTRLTRRREIWLTAFDLASHLAPRRENPPAGFVRAGLFHWYELGPDDRKKILEVAAPLMREPRFFQQTYLPLWQLTRDLGYLRRVAPASIDARIALRDLAAANGLFADYRSLRKELRAGTLAEFERWRASATPVELLSMLPERITTSDEPLIRGLLEEIDRKPFTPQASERIERLVEFALRHRLQPLRGLLPVVETAGLVRDVTRARIALAMGDHSLATRIEMSSAILGAPEWAPYYLDRALYEARRGETSVADAYLARARMAGLTERVRAGTIVVYEAMGRTKEAVRMSESLGATRSPRVWTGLCKGGDLCSGAVSTGYAVEGEGIIVRASMVQSDEVPPYLEVYLDDELVAEGEVSGDQTFTAKATTTGSHRLEVILVNRLTRNGVHRLVRLS